MAFLLYALIGVSALAAGLALGLLALGARLRKAQACARDDAREMERLRDEIWELKAAAAARDRAEAASEAKSRFLANVSHEIRTPLNGVLGMADLLAAMDLGAEADSYIAAIRTSGAALTGLIDEILDFSRIESGRLELENAPFELAPLIEGVVELLASRAQDKGVEIAASIDAALPARILGDAGRLRQIVLNLAGNAVKFTDRGGVGVEATDEGGRLVVRIRDTGPGVAPDRRAAIFEEFEQADNSSTSRHGGTGLGLAISRRLAETMGGALLLEHSSQSGSCFRLELPLRPAETVPDAVADSLPAAPLSGRRALIVAASPFAAPYLGAFLDRAGAQVRAVASLAEAQAALAPQAGAGVFSGVSSGASAEAFDVVIVDCALGPDVAKAVADAARGARTLVMVSPFERRLMDRALFASFDGWLVKPVRQSSLAQRLMETGAPARTAAPQDAPVAPLAGVTLLLAEDNDINALIAMRQLERAGAVVTRVCDGLAACAALAPGDQGAPYDAALLDIRMPGLDGLAVARAQRRSEALARCAALPLIALTANAAADDRRQALEAGFDRFLVKPFAPEDLVGAIAGAMATRRDDAERRCG